MSTKDTPISTKGLDDFSRRFLSRSKKEGEEEIKITRGQKLSDTAVRQYDEQKKVDFIKRAGKFTEDLIGFIVEQKRMRDLSDPETIFGLALMSINLRQAYGSPQGNEAKISDEDRQKLLEMFDEICWGAQQYWDANQ